MKSTVKGFIVEMNVAISIKCGEATCSNIRGKKDTDIFRDSNESFKDLDLSVSVGGKLAIDESDGEIDTHELCNILHTNLREEMHREIEDELKSIKDTAYDAINKTADKAAHEAAYKVAKEMKE